jgi:AcrR family transcriptional regulator
MASYHLTPNLFDAINHDTESEATNLGDTREYNSPARDQAKEATREKIVDAVVRVVLDDGIHAFTVQNVADKAGVSHRTVYRHFKTREELLAGLAASIEAKSEQASFPTDLATVDDIIDNVGSAFETMSEGADHNRACVVTSIAMQWQDEPRQRRSQALNRIMRAAFPNLNSGEVREASALIRSISGSRCWYLLTFEGGLDAKAAARAADWAVRVLFKDLRRRDQAAAKRTNGS